MLNWQYLSLILHDQFESVAPVDRESRQCVGVEEWIIMEFHFLFIVFHRVIYVVLVSYFAGPKNI